MQLPGPKSMKWLSSHACGAALVALLTPVPAVPAQPAAAVAPANAFEGLLERAARGDTIRVVFLGGSNTIGNTTHPLRGVDVELGPFDVQWYDRERHSFRALVMSGLQQEYGVRPDQFVEINAALGGTPSALAAWRLGPQVLRPHGPVDLVLLEWVVNDFQALVLSPEDERSIPRSMKSLLQQLEADSPDAAVLSILTTVRGGIGAPVTEIQRATAASRREHLRFVSDWVARTGTRDLGVVDADYWFYRQTDFQPGPPFLGDAEGKHPSPYGHEIIAYGVLETVRALASGGQQVLPPFPAYSAALPPFPRRPRVVDAHGILDACRESTGFHVGTSQDETPILRGTDVLYATAPGDELVYEFAGAGVFDLWTQKRYGVLRLNARIEVQVDDRPRMLLTEPPEPGADARLLRYAPIATGLPAGRHVVRVRVLDPPDNGLPMRLGFHGFLLDTGAH